MAVDPFAEANYPLRVIRVASHDKDGNELDKPLYGIPLTYMSVHHNEYISTQMETDYYGPTWWFRVRITNHNIQRSDNLHMPFALETRTFMCVA